MSKPTLEYEPPPRQTEPNARWAFVAFMAVMAIFPVAAFVGAVLAESIWDGPYAGLGGIIYGLAAASAFQFVVLAVGIMLLRRRHDPRKRGIGHGMILAAGFSLVVSGLCFGTMMLG